MQSAASVDQVDDGDGIAVLQTELLLDESWSLAFFSALRWARSRACILPIYHFADSMSLDVR